jgi:nucleoid DNA-binding protein
MRRALVRGRPVALTNVGTLEPFTKKSTRYRHPETGEMETTPRRRHIRFILSPSLKDDLRRTRR